MASVRTMQSGDTYPPLRGYAVDEDGPVDLTEALSMRVMAKGSTHRIELEATVIDPPLVLGDETYNWQALFNDATETSVPDTYVVQLEVTWAAGSVETFPNSHAGAPMLVIELANEAA